MPSNRKFGVIVAVITLLLALLNIGLSIRAAVNLFTSASESDQSQLIIESTNELLLTVLDMETGARGFLVTNDREYLQPFEAGLKVVSMRTETLKQLVPAKQSTEQVQLIATEVEKQVEFLKQLVAARDSVEADSPPQLVLADKGKRSMDRIRELVNDFQNQEKWRLVQRNDRTRQSYRNAIVSAIASGLSVLFFISFYYELSRQYSLSILKQSQIATEKSDLLETTYRSIGEGVVTTDAQGLVTDLNQIAENLTGWTKLSAVGQPLAAVLKVFDEDSRQPLSLSTLETFKQPSETNRRIGMVHRAGQNTSIDFAMSPIIKTDGHAAGKVLVFRDVSERRRFETQLLNSERSYRTLFELAPIGIAQFSLDGQLIHANQFLCELLHVERQDLVGRTIDQLSPTDDALLCRKAIDKLLQGDDDYFTIEQRLNSSTAETVYTNTTATLVQGEAGNNLSIIMAFMDVSDRRAAEDARRRMAAIVNTSNDAIITKEFSGIVTSWNPAAERLFGFGNAEMVGHSVFAIIPEECREEEAELLRRCAHGESTEPFHTTRLHRDGHRLEVLLRVTPLLDGAGNSLGVCTIVRDLTEELRVASELRESESRFRMLADNMSQFAWMANPEGWIYWYNKRWYDYTGTTLEEMQGWGWMTVHHPDHIERVVQRIQHCWDTGTPWEDTFPLRSKDGTYRWFLSRALPIRDGKGRITNWFGSNTDITELIENEQSLKKARHQAEAASRARGEFLANMSHELRTPMTAILGHADILAEHIADPDDIQSIDTIRRNGKFLLQIINDILDLSKIDAGRFDIDQVQFSPSELLHEIRSLLDVRATEKKLDFNVSIEGSIPQVISSDPVRLRQILVNLAGNAIKFTDNGQVEIKCQYTAESNRLQFHVIDTGIGVPEEFQQSIFEPFVQADASSTRAFEGTGLGLAISRRLAHALGGDISVASEPGKGSDFTLEISCGELDDVKWVSRLEPPIAQGVNTRLDTLSGTVLVVDDRRDIRFLAQNFLEKAGARVVVATHGQEAIDHLTQSDPIGDDVSAVLMDMQMPIMDGYTAARKMREMGFQKPIIALTANAMKEDRDKCLQCGCDDYATKPLDGPMLIHIVAMNIDRFLKSHS